jgi:pimeloyl-ACP methyl ester carboxylesterase
MSSPSEHSRDDALDPLVLLHGIGSSAGAWRPVTGALEVRHEVLALDLPGFGGAPELPRGTRPDVAALADAVERELDSAGFDRPHVAGNSLGGWTALELARRGRARRVVALSPAGMWTERERRYSDAMLRLTYAVTRRLRAHSRVVASSTAARTALFSIVASRGWRLDPEDARQAIEALADADVFLETLEATLGDRANRLDQIAVPTLIAWGTRDRLLPPRQGPRFARSIPGAELRFLPGCGHVPMWDDPNLVAATILGFTRSEESASRALSAAGAA